jgi:gamma-glutamyltranspeptidase/glutathione hydrolase
MDLRPGDAGDGTPRYATFDVAADNRRALGLGSTDFKDLETRDPHAADTVHLDAVDAEGNMVSATPSGWWLGDSPIIKGLGFPLGTRGQMFYLNPARPNALAPHKRPRATLTPSLVTRSGRPFMVFGTPGGDAQEQLTLQFFLNHEVFDMNIQEAIEAPTVYIHHFPNSFYPRTAYPGEVSVESRIPMDVVSALKRRGHKVGISGAWRSGEVTAVRYDSATGVISAGASPNGGLAYAIAW